MNKYKVKKIEEIIKSYEEEKNKFFNTNNAIDLIRKNTSFRKNYHYELLSIIATYFDLSVSKIKEGFIVENYIKLKELNKEKELTTFNINSLKNQNLYILLARKLSNEKGNSILLPLKLFNKISNDKKEALSLDLEDDIYIVCDYLYFKVLINNGNATHRLVGLCESIELLEEKAIRLRQTKYKTITNKILIQKTVNFLKTIDESSLISSINIESYKFFIIELHNQSKIKIEFKSYDEIIDLVNLKNFNKENKICFFINTELYRKR